ncbi:MAG TPA: VWA domain-containing protein [Pyrinomonadaceae bacterium]|nr:VWA domain-containing protein [Pyrinomonadaceae bacterium]
MPGKLPSPRIRGELLLSIATLVLSVCSFNGQAAGQSGDVVRIRTRVVFVDVLVKDKRTKALVTDLKVNNFEIFDNGRLRQLTYFSRPGEKTERPLALVVLLAPMDDRARNSMQNPAILKSMATALAKLPPEDELAVMFSWWGGVVPPQTLVAFTHDRSQISTALANMPSFARPVSPDISGSSPQSLKEALATTAAERPRSQVAVIMITDSVYQMTTLERDDMTASLLRNNVTLNALITGTDRFFLFSYPVLKPASSVLGVSLYGVPSYLAQQTGGAEVRVRKPQDYGAALEQVIGDLSSRYSLGFTLAEDEPDDGRFHQLKVKVAARDLGGKERKLTAITRKGYYVPKTKL